jgi:VWFA-related protein
MHRLYVALLGFLLSISSLAGQTQPAQQGSSGQSHLPTVRTTSKEVLLDMVVHDKSGRAIREIRPEQVHVLEDGVEQKLTSFRLVEGNAQPGASAPGAAGTTTAPAHVDPMREIRLVTLVFQGLDQNGKRFFRQALDDMLNTSPEPNLYFSIYVIDQKLYCIQPFTNDHKVLQEAAKRSATWANVKYETESKAIQDTLEQQISGGEPTLTSTTGPGGGGPSQSQIQSFVNYQMAKMQYDMLKAAGAAQREYDARATITGLLALVQGEGKLPGRKVVTYFNPWLQIPEDIREAYKYLISESNRSNVTFYTVDPKGLWSGGQDAQRSGGNMYSAMGGESQAGVGQLSGALSEIRNQQMRGGVGEISTSQARAMGEAGEAMRANPLQWLRDLANQTGGIPIANTNDTKAPLKAVMEEVRTYFEATYIPSVSVYDGKFRAITVSVDVPGANVLSRSGYFAVPPNKGGQQMYAYEMPLLQALNSLPVPKDVAFNVAADRFNGQGPKIEYMLTIQTPLKDLTFVPHPELKKAVVDAALMAVVKNSNGEIVENFSKDFAVQVDLDKVEGYKAGDLVQSFQAELAPGEYTLDSVVMDRNANKIGVQESTLKVPVASSKLSMSSVVVIRRTEKVDGDQALNAFYFPGGKVVPTLTHTLKGGPGNMLPFYFTVYPDPSISDAPKLIMNFYKEGEYLGAAQAQLPPVQKDGRIPYIADLPADKFTPGSYEIRLNIVQGDSQAEEKVSFQVN